MYVILKCVALVFAVSSPVFVQQASGEDDFINRFRVAPDAHPSEIYAAFIEIAADLCRVDRQQAGDDTIKARIEANCTEALVADAVRASRMDDLIAYHNQQVDPHVRIGPLARRE
ncbi:MAG: hypothetical protein CMK09_15990 [Ponticaulis sp.]|nr:hypothetical protein [Ponticaulis sp.]